MTYDSIFVPQTAVIQGFNVGLRVDHPRISDLTFTLIDPNRNRYQLMENRGGATTNGCGLTILTTNLTTTGANGTALPVTNYVNTGSTSGTLPVIYNFYTAPDQMTIYYGTNVATTNLIYDTGVTNNPKNVPPQTDGGAQDTSNETFTVTYGPINGIVSTYVTIVMNAFLPTNRGTQWTYTTRGVVPQYEYLAFTEDTNLTTTPVKFAALPLVPPAADPLTNLYCQPEQSLTPLIGTNPKGTWQLEVLDNRAGATNTATTLLSWRLEFTFANTNTTLPTILGFQHQINLVNAGSIVWYQVTVPAAPTNASFATNILDFATTNVNLLFSTNNPPTTAGPGDAILLNNSTGGQSTITTNSVPFIVPDAVYYLGVQNTNSVAVTYGIGVNFDHGNQPPGPASIKLSPALVSSGQSSDTSMPKFSMAPPGAGGSYQIQWKNNLTDPWQTITDPSLTTDANGNLIFKDDGTQTTPMKSQRYYRVVWIP